jgi:hypothetical protein
MVYHKLQKSKLGLSRNGWLQKTVKMKVEHNTQKI